MLAPLWRWVYVVVTGYSAAAGPYVLTWSYTPPTPSRTVHWSPTASRTTSATWTRASVASPSNTATTTLSSHATASQTATLTAAVTRASTPFATPTATPSFGACGSTILVTSYGVGVSGSVSGNLAGQQTLFPYGNCLSEPAGDGLFDGSYNVLLPAAQILVVISLGYVPPANGSLVVDTCPSDFDTTLWLGTSCPSNNNFANMNCIAMNDDAPAFGNGCSTSYVTGNPSRVAVTTDGVTSTYYAIVGGYYGAVGTYVLNWNYSPSASATPSQTATPTLTHSRGASASLTPGPTPSGTAVPTATPTASATGTNRQNAFQPTSVVVLQVGTGAATLFYSPGQAFPLALSEVGVVGATAGSLLQSITVPSSGPNACTLSIGASALWYYDQEGIPTQSNDGRSVVFPCYASTAGGNLDYTSNKVIAIVRGDGSVDTGSVIISGLPGSPFANPPTAAWPQALRTALTGNTSSFLFAGIGGDQRVSTGCKATLTSSTTVTYSQRYVAASAFRNRYAYDHAPPLLTHVDVAGHWRLPRRFLHGQWG